MTAYADLSDLQHVQLATWMQMARQRVAQMANMLNSLEQLDELWEASVLPIVTTLDAETIIPDNVPAGGAAQLQREQVLALMVSIEDILTNHYATANKTNLILIAGMFGIF